MTMMTAASEIIDRLHRRASVRAFGPDPIPEPLLGDLLAAAVHAPTSFNFQAYCLIVVTDRSSRERLAELVSQGHVARAPAVIVVCADVRRLYRLGQQAGEPVGPEHRDLMTTAIIDASLAGMCLALAAESVGLGTVMVGAVRGRPEDVAALLGLPGDVSPLFAVCAGWPAQAPTVRPRLRPDLLAHPDRYDADRAEGALHTGESALWTAGRPATRQEIADWHVLVKRGLGRARHHHITIPALTEG
jgi:nitroreductase